MHNYYPHKYQDAKGGSAFFANRDLCIFMRRSLTIHKKRNQKGLSLSNGREPGANGHRNRDRIKKKSSYNDTDTLRFQIMQLLN